jgi:hypothetical protein
MYFIIHLLVLLRKISETVASQVSMPALPPHLSNKYSPSVSFGCFLQTKSQLCAVPVLQLLVPIGQNQSMPSNVFLQRHRCLRKGAGQPKTYGAVSGHIF